MNIDEQIKIERESLETAIFPRERREHAEKLASLMKDKYWIDAKRAMLSSADKAIGKIIEERDRRNG